MNFYSDPFFILRWWGKLTRILMIIMKYDAISFSSVSSPSHQIKPLSSLFLPLICVGLSWRGFWWLLWNMMLFSFSSIGFASHQIKVLTMLILISLICVGLSWRGFWWLLWNMMLFSFSSTGFGSHQIKALASLFLSA